MFVTNRLIKSSSVFYKYMNILFFSFIVALVIFNEVVVLFAYSK